eukprot:2270702-Rhodomonas_salina.2
MSFGTLLLLAGNASGTARVFCLCTPSAVLSGTELAYGVPRRPRWRPGLLVCFPTSLRARYAMPGYPQVTLLFGAVMSAPGLRCAVRMAGVREEQGNLVLSAIARRARYAMSGTELARAEQREEGEGGRRERREKGREEKEGGGRRDEGTGNREEGAQGEKEREG